MESAFCPAKTDTCIAGDTQGQMLGCGDTVSFTESFVYLDSLLRSGLSDHHGTELRQTPGSVPSPEQCATREVVLEREDLR